MKIIIANGTYDWSLTIDNLIRIGIFEEVYALYSELCNIAYEQDDFFLENAVFKKSLNNFFTSYYQIFSDKKFRVNDAILKSKILFKMIIHSEKLSFRLVTFSEFLIELERLIIVIFKWKEDKCDLASRRFNQEVLDDLHSHIVAAIKTGLSNRDVLSREINKYLISKDSYVIFVYTNLFNLKCYRDRHPLKLKILTVDTLNSSLTYNLPVTYCEECKTFFIGKTTLNAIQNYAGVILAKFKECNSDFSYDANFNRNNESELYSCGYNVIKGKLTSKERKNLLKYLIDNKIMTIPDIIYDLENAMRPFYPRPNYQDAIKAWEGDLVFVNRYKNGISVGKGTIKR